MTVLNEQDDICLITSPPPRQMSLTNKEASEMFEKKDNALLSRINEIFRIMLQ